MSIKNIQQACALHYLTDIPQFIYRQREKKYSVVSKTSLIDVSFLFCLIPDQDTVWPLKCPVYRRPICTRQMTGRKTNEARLRTNSSLYSGLVYLCECVNVACIYCNVRVCVWALRYFVYPVDGRQQKAQNHNTEFGIRCCYLSQCKCIYVLYTKRERERQSRDVSLITTCNNYNNQGLLIMQAVIASNEHATLILLLFEFDLRRYK